ncbi:MAG: biotin transporter BioY [Candidatus Goldbacteria bacterium]|nr:biotin transporter BioY [Candidatus Goldiibacteriota bacterium]
MKEYADVLRKEYTLPLSLKNVFLILIFSYLTFCGAMIKVYTPFTPVPFTLQNFVLFISVYFLKEKDISISQLLYILFGFIGVPVFAVGLTGAAIFLGPTAGYLLGFVIAGALMAFFYNRIKQKNYIKIFILFLTGAILILLFGTLHLAFIYGFGIKKAIMVGFLPFIFTDILKVMAASLIYRIVK